MRNNLWRPTRELWGGFSKSGILLEGGICLVILFLWRHQYEIRTCTTLEHRILEQTFATPHANRVLEHSRAAQPLCESARGLSRTLRIHELRTCYYKLLHKLITCYYYYYHYYDLDGRQHHGGVGVLQPGGHLRPRILASGLRVWGAGYRVWGARCRVQGAGSGVQGAGCRVQGAGCRVQDAGCRVQRLGFGVQGSGCRVWGAGCRVQGLGFGVWGSGCRVCGAGCRVWGAGCRGAYAFDDAFGLLGVAGWVHGQRVEDRHLILG